MKLRPITHHPLLWTQGCPLLTLTEEQVSFLLVGALFTFVSQRWSLFSLLQLCVAASRLHRGAASGHSSPLPSYRNSFVRCFGFC